MSWLFGERKRSPPSIRDMILMRCPTCGMYVRDYYDLKKCAGGCGKTICPHCGIQLPGGALICPRCYGLAESKPKRILRGLLEFSSMLEGAHRRGFESG